MNNEIKIFESAEFGSVRTIDLNGVIYFVGKDVAEALGYSNSRKALNDHVDEEDVTKRYPLLTNGGIQEVNLINESGLYALIFGSQLPEAKKFKRWVTNEVLPQIRKTGGYNVDQSYQQLAERVERLEKMINQQSTSKNISYKQPIIENCDLSCSERVIYSIIANNINSYDYVIADFQRKSNLSRRTIMRCLSILNEKGYISKDVEYVNGVKYCHYAIIDD